MNWEQTAGDPKEFAVRIVLVDDPDAAPTSDGRMAASWGSLELWVRDRCLTRAFHRSENTLTVFTWYLAPLLDWLRSAWWPLLHEGSVPRRVTDDELSSGIAWFESSAMLPMSMGEGETSAWLRDRSAWSDRHLVSKAWLDAAAPRVCLRRDGDDIEISWNHQVFPPSRTDVQFVEAPGVERVCGATVARVLRETWSALQAVLPGAAGSPPWSEGQDLAWQWLVAPHVRQAAQADPRLAARLGACTGAAHLEPGWVQHCLSTWLLRNTFLSTPADVHRILDLVSDAPATDLTPGMQALRSPSPAAGPRPVLQGYEHALKVRRDLGLGDEPLPSVGNLMIKNGIVVIGRPLPGAIDAVTWTSGGQGKGAAVAVGRRRTLRSTEAMAKATALGHLLLDAPLDRDWAEADGVGLDWPAAARARGFGTMFLLPEGALRSAMRRKKRVNASMVTELSNAHQLGPVAVTWHMQNLGLIGQEERLALVSAATGIQRERAHR